MLANSSGVLASGPVYFIIFYYKDKLKLKTGNGCCVF